MSSPIFQKPATAAEAAALAVGRVSGKEQESDGEGQFITPPPPSKIAKGGVTPMMAQFLGIKADHPDSLLFYRMGDFYELFFEDAVRAGKMLGLTCTSRQQHNGEPIPMAGVPHHAIEGYIDLALQAGVAVVMVDQVEDPAQAKGIVKRAVTRIETPGIRPAGTDTGDQKRVLTPPQAIEAGASWLVIGRPICAAENPRAAAEAILDSLAGSAK